MKGCKLFLVLCLAALPALASAQQIDLVLTSVSQVSDRHVDAYLTLVNPTKYSEGTLSIAFSNNLEIDRAERNWDCFTAQDDPRNTCTTRVQVIGHEQFRARFVLKKFFQSDFVYVSYQVPQLNITIVTKFLISHTADPNRISASALFYSALVLLVFGLLAWVLAFESGRLKCLPGPAGRAFGALNDSILFGAVLSNLLVALGIVIIFSPVYSPFTVALFATVFAAGVLFLFHVRQVSGRAEFACQPDVAREKARFEEMIRVARAKFMRNEIDEKTFRDVAAKIEMEIIKLEAGEKRRQPT